MVLNTEGKLTLLNVDTKSQDFKSVQSETVLPGCSCLTSCDYKNFILLLGISKKIQATNNSAVSFENYLYYGSISDFFQKTSMNFGKLE